MKKIYFAGICGIAMGTLALMFRERGWEVSGSDENMYPPMSDLLKLAGVELREGFSAENVPAADLAVIGNALSRGNPEIEHILNCGMPFMSMAGALREFFLKEKEVIAVCGTHGKSTTTALLAHILQSAGSDPSFFLGGVSQNFNSSYRLGKGLFFVVEGDEYDSAFFEKYPKFIIYRPGHAVLSSLEFDHADIYSGIDEIELWFKRLINIIPSKGSIVYSSEYSRLPVLMKNAFSTGCSFGEKSGDFAWEYKGLERGLSVLDCRHGDLSVTLKTPLFGRFNYQNIAAASAMALLLGADAQKIAGAVGTFCGVKRRQEIIYERGNFTLIEDFAHHPTAVRGMIASARERYPDAKISVFYEPRSATSRRNVFQNEIAAAFQGADSVLIARPYKADSLPAEIRLDPFKLRDDIVKSGIEADLYGSAEEMVEFFAKNSESGRMNAALLLSNGAFMGIYAKLIKRLDEMNNCGLN